MTAGPMTGNWSMGSGRPEKVPEKVIVVGAGMAGLSAALHLSQATKNITLYESASHAGGRCRSYLDRDLGVAKGPHGQGRDGQGPGGRGHGAVRGHRKSPAEDGYQEARVRTTRG